MPLWWICKKMLLLRILCGARQQLLHQGHEVLILTMARLKPLCRNRSLSDFNQSVLGRIILAITATLKPATVKVFQTLWNRGDVLKTLKQTLKGLLSPLHSTSTINENVALTVRTTTLGTKPRNDRRPLVTRETLKRPFKRLNGHFRALKRLNV